MKIDIATKIALLAIIVCISRVSAYSQLWPYEGSPGFSANAAYCTSMAISPANVPYIAYQDAANNYAVTVMKYNGTAWTGVGNAGFSPAGASFVSLSVSSAGIPYVAFIDDSSNRASVMKYNGSQWVFVGGAFFSDSAIAVAFALGANDTAYIAYPDVAYGSKVTVMKYNGTAWVNVGASGFSDSADEVALAIDKSTNTPYIAYTDALNGDNTTVMMYSGGTWTTVGTPGFSAADAYYPSLAISGNGTPYIAYQDGAYSGMSTVMKYTLGTWSNVGSPGFSAGAAYYTSLAIDSAGVPFLAYQDDGNNNALTVAEYTGTTWASVGPAGCTAGTADYTSLAIDRHGRLYVGYEDGAMSFYAGVVVYQNCNTGTPSISAAAAGGDTICPGAGPLLNAAGGNTYLWSTGATQSAIRPVLHDTDAVYKFYVTGTAANGCASSDSVTVYTRSQPPPVFVSPDTTMCRGDTTLLSAAGGITYSWSNGATSSSVYVSPASTTTYYVAGADAQGCADTAFTTVNIDKGPSLVFTGKDTLCKGDSTLLVVSGGLNYLWQPEGSTQDSLFLVPDSTVTYIVSSADSGGCVSKDSVTLVVQLCNGINNILFAQGFSVLPNPAHNTLFFTAYSPLANAELTLYNINGQIIKHTYIENLVSGERKAIDISALNNGIYYLKVISVKGVAVYKVIKE